MSRSAARHKKQPSAPAPAPGAQPRHRRQPPGGPGRRRHAAALAATATGSTLLVGGAVLAAVTLWPGRAQPAQNLDALRAGGSPTLAGAPAAAARLNERWLKKVYAESARADGPGGHAGPGAGAGAAGKQPAAQPPAPVYRNPFRSAALRPERVDMGVDFGGSGPVYALGNAVITQATGDSPGWPGGGWITYRLTDGPAAGLSVYLAEDVKPAVQVGQQVSAATVIASMYDGGAGIETGWAQPGGGSAESQLAEAGGISGGGPFPTRVGLNFEDLLQALGVVAAPNRDEQPSGILPPKYPAAWTAGLLTP